MMLEQVKSLIGENCPAYEANNIFYKANMTNLVRNCINCFNYKNGKCTKNLFNELYENLKIN